MSARLVAIDFACNDPDNGDFAGRTAMVSAVWLGDAELEAPSFEGFTFSELGATDRVQFPVKVRIHRKEFAVVQSRSWVGNWCWNRYFFRRAEAKRLILTLRANGWRCTCGPSRFFDWMNAERAA
ncbi:MAG: hypothetical protein P0Y59_02590 [Candidatus Sphingomonas phytovorans]|nr:hypothetical protein [Sphingomonas sp.]WEK00599.1 MAG: hypothetical protein P0Y59_02590 [Sphingomonas sp.]